MAIYAQNSAFLSKKRKIFRIISLGGRSLLQRIETALNLHHIGEHIVLFARVAQERRGMIYGANGKGAALKPYAVLGGDAEIRLYQPHCRYSAEADDKLRRNGANLLAQVLYAEILLLRLRVAVFGRAALPNLQRRILILLLS